MLKTIFWLLGIYVLYKLIVDFIMPVSRATKQMRHQMKGMQEKMEEQYRAQSGYPKQNPTPEHTESKPDKADYIDFEEIKK
jgi:Sec-independent protein translocase protein TatA